MASIGIAGAGLLGRLLAWRLTGAGHRVAVFDPAQGPAPRFDGHDAAAFTAAGMLSPVAELENASGGVARVGLRSIALWRQIVAALPGRPFFAQRGSLLLAHRSDLGAAERVLARLRKAAEPGLVAEALEQERLRALEPALCGIAHAWYLAGEAHLDAVGVMTALYEGALGARWHFGAAVRGEDRQTRPQSASRAARSRAPHGHPGRAGANQRAVPARLAAGAGTGRRRARNHEAGCGPGAAARIDAGMNAPISIALDGKDREIASGTTLAGG